MDSIAAANYDAVLFLNNMGCNVFNIGFPADAIFILKTAVKASKTLCHEKMSQIVIDSNIIHRTFEILAKASKVPCFHRSPSITLSLDCSSPLLGSKLLHGFCKDKMIQLTRTSRYLPDAIETAFVASVIIYNASLACLLQEEEAKRRKGYEMLRLIGTELQELIDSLIDDDLISHLSCFLLDIVISKLHTLSTEY